MGARDVYEHINEQDDATVGSFVNRLEFRSKDATFSQFRDEYLDRIQLAPSATVLDIGCGTGVLARALAARPAFTGRVVGIDQSPVLIEAARRFASQEGLGDQIDFRVGDVHALDLADASFDAVIAHTLVSHVRDPRTVLGEAARVVQPGGWVAIFDGDYASWTFGCSDPDLGKTMDEALIATVVGQPRVMREMPRLLPEVGLDRVDTIGYVYADIGKGSFFPGAVTAYAPLIIRSGLVSAEHVEAWVADQRQAMEAGVFFAACNFYAHLARRPG
jgi:ubiquinone/menaquinone biosynthesis C-methylase UbiE